MYTEYVKMIKDGMNYVQLVEHLIAAENLCTDTTFGKAQFIFLEYTIDTTPGK